MVVVKDQEASVWRSVGNLPAKFFTSVERILGEELIKSSGELTYMHSVLFTGQPTPHPSHSPHYLVGNSYHRTHSPCLLHIIHILHNPIAMDNNIPHNSSTISILPEIFTGQNITYPSYSPQPPQFP
jgi:hypothetical protein